MSLYFATTITFVLCGIVTSYDPYFCKRRHPNTTWPSQYDCSSYYQCAADNSTSHHVCGYATVWNQKAAECDRPENVDCERQTEEYYNRPTRNDKLPGVSTLLPSDAEVGASGHHTYTQVNATSSHVVHLDPNYVIHKSGSLIAFYYKKSTQGGILVFQVWRHVEGNGYKLIYKTTDIIMSGDASWTEHRLVEVVSVEEDDLLAVHMHPDAELQYTTDGTCLHGKNSPLQIKGQSIFNEGSDYTFQQIDSCRSYAFGALVDIRADKDCELLIAERQPQFMVSHPGYDQGHNYPSEYNKCWVIRAIGNSVSVELADGGSSADISNSNGCVQDYLKIYHAPAKEENVTAGTFCGNVRLGTQTTNGSYLAVYFVTDSLDTAKGFKLEYKSIAGEADGGEPPLSGGLEDMEANQKDIELSDGEYMAIAISVIVFVLLVAVIVFIVWWCHGAGGCTCCGGTSSSNEHKRRLVNHSNVVSAERSYEHNHSQYDYYHRESPDYDYTDHHGYQTPRCTLDHGHKQLPPLRNDGSRSYRSSRRARNSEQFLRDRNSREIHYGHDSPKNEHNKHSFESRTNSVENQEYRIWSTSFKAPPGGEHNDKNIIKGSTPNDYKTSIA